MVSELNSSDVYLPKYIFYKCETHNASHIENTNDEKMMLTIIMKWNKDRKWNAILPYKIVTAFEKRDERWSSRFHPQIDCIFILFSSHRWTSPTNNNLIEIISNVLLVVYRDNKFILWAYIFFVESFYSFGVLHLKYLESMASWCNKNSTKHHENPKEISNIL